MTVATKKQEFERLLENFRTEWFIYEAANPTNINQINTICQQILLLNFTQNTFDDEQRNSRN